jgi:methylthioribose-1-phosphate isomerase
VSRLPHPEPLSGEGYSAVELSPDAERVIMLDQRELPEREVYYELSSVDEVAEAIRAMVVRGAPAIGISAAYGMVLAAARSGAASAAALEVELARAGERLEATRPTAVNLRWAVQRMLARARGLGPSAVRDVLVQEALAIHREDVASCRRMGVFGAKHVPDGATILTHCNAGALATGGYGTALGVIRAARDAGKRVRVLADETRPYLQGARLTAWELHKSQIDVTVICDNSAAYWFGRGAIDLTVVGADRIARNGDVANKIGTYNVACLSKLHDRPFYVAAPWSTFDLNCRSGADIPIEQRDGREITEISRGQGDGVYRFAVAAGPAEEGSALAGRAAMPAFRHRLVPEGVGVLNPAFDVTPGTLVTSLFTERGVVAQVGEAGIAALAQAGTAAPEPRS